MGTSWEQYGLDVIRGEARGVGATLARWGLAGVAGVYGGVMRVRNVKYDRGLGVRRLPRPVVSVGNLTTGGTGKTPVVRWLCERLREAGGRPAVLMRGYKARPGERGDEQAMLEGLLGDLVVRAGADRYEAGLAVLREHPEVSVFVLDDGFQHRRLGRDFDLVLVDGSEPFGYGRVLPRGLLREPMEGLARADAVLITRADQAKDVERIVRAVRSVNAGAPVYRCSHAHGGLRGEDEAVRPMEWLAGKRFFAFAGIGNPAGLEGQLRGVAGTMAGRRWFGDHWSYGAGDLEAVRVEAMAAGAEVVVTTEKDWVKVRGAWAAAGAGMPIVRLQLAVRFQGEDEERLLGQIRGRI